VQYYTTCSTLQAKSSVSKYYPFKHELNRANSKLRTALTLYNDNLVGISKQILGEQTLKYVKSYSFQKKIESIEELINKIRSMISCEQTNNNYKQAVNSVCTHSM
jgi:hypothetical protein